MSQSLNTATILQPRVPRFSPGQTFITPGASGALTSAGKNAFTFLRRHLFGDWGELSEDDRQENELSLEQGFRLLSAYQIGDEQRIWIITEADRSSTTILLPSEY